MMDVAIDTDMEAVIIQEEDSSNWWFCEFYMKSLRMDTK